MNQKDDSAKAKSMTDALGDDGKALVGMLINLLNNKGIPGAIALEISEKGMIIANSKARCKLPALDMMRTLLLSSAEDGCGLDGLIAACLSAFDGAYFVRNSVFFQTLKKELPEGYVESFKDRVSEVIGESLVGLDEMPHSGSGSLADSFRNLKKEVRSLKSECGNPFSDSAPAEDDLRRKSASGPTPDYDGDFESLSMDKKYDFANKIKDLCQVSSGVEITLDGSDYFLRFPVNASDPEHFFEDFQIQQEDGFNVINLTSLYARAGSLPYLKEIL